ncbi:MAG: preprotein translocase subunit SecY [Firmicutes bacterium]|uniref:Protein translocase subunit SecY n=1 Tax=Candidatus Scatoplasma merdavium TaxID=2840932 RepID=A0A9D9D6W8_9BACL|nr:preprotein translocase subunit SecY [Candidatus Scatoplasma merdavium]
MKKIAAILHNKDVLNRILFTFAIFLIFRIGSAITIPGVTVSDGSFQSSDILSLMNLLGGGALQQFSLFALGVSPYITSQIIVQLLQTDVLPSLTELTKEGEAGRHKIEMTTRYLTILLGAVQAYGIIVTMQNTQGLTVNDTSFWGYCQVIIIMIAGTMLLMWLGDQITEKGIGNGISMIIFAGIVSALPNQIISAFEEYLGQKILTDDASLILEGTVQLTIYILAFIAIIVFVTFIETSIRKLPVSHSASSQSKTSLAAKSSFLPLKINSASVIPVIFASSLMMAPSIIVSFIGGANPPNWAKQLVNVFNFQTMVQMPGPNGTTWPMPWGLIIYLLLIVGFTFFYANLQINPERMAQNFQESGTYITGLRPGLETQKYISKVLNRITFIGAMALMFIAGLPVVLSLTGAVPQSMSLGGTGMIIVVGVALEVMRQIDGLLAGKNYETKGA